MGILEEQWALAEAHAEQLRAEHSTSRPARELFRELVGWLDHSCPAVFLTLTGQKLHKLLLKGSLPVAGEVLNAYREEKARRQMLSPTLPLPADARQALSLGLEQLWESAFHTVKRELASKESHLVPLLRKELQDTQEAISELEDKLAGRAEESLTLLHQVQSLEGENRDLYERIAETQRFMDVQTAGHAREVGFLETHLRETREELQSTRIAADALSSKAYAEIDAARQEVLKAAKRERAERDLREAALEQLRLEREEKAALANRLETVTARAAALERELRRNKNHRLKRRISPAREA